MRPALQRVDVAQEVASDRLVKSFYKSILVQYYFCLSVAMCFCNHTYTVGFLGSAAERWYVCSENQARDAHWRDRPKEIEESVTNKLFEFKFIIYTKSRLGRLFGYVIRSSCACRSRHQCARWRKPYVILCQSYLSSARSSARFRDHSFNFRGWLAIKSILLPRSFRENKLLMKIKSWNRLPRPFRDRTISPCLRTWVSLPEAQLSFIMFHPHFACLLGGFWGCSGYHEHLEAT